MPSRHKKVLRDSMLTNSFFNQAGSSGCSCCPGHSHGPATTSSKPGDADDNKSAAMSSVDRSLSSVMASYWKEKYNSLTPEEVKKLHAAIDAKKTVSDPKVAMVALKLAHKQMKDVPATADPYPPIENFDLSDLDEVAKKYDKFCKMYQDDEERGIASLAGLIGDLAVTASDVERSPEDRLAAELDIQNLNIYSKVIVPLNSCLRQVQVFNIEKRFGFVEESYHALCDEDQRWRREDVPAETPLSYRQKWNNPFNLTASAPKPRKKKEKKTLSGIEALVKLQRNCKLAIEGMKDLKQTTNDAEKPIELQSVPGSSTYADVPIPEDIPDHVRQRFFDAELAFQEVLNLQEEASKLLLRVRGTFVVWYSTGDEEWEFGKKRIHEMALFREYEYTRVSLHAQFYVASRQEVKIVEFYGSEGAPKLPLEMNAAFRLKSLSPKEFEKDWEVRCNRLKIAIPSVDKMVAEIDEMLKETAEEDRPKTAWGKLLVDNTQRANNGWS